MIIVELHNTDMKLFPGDAWMHGEMGELRIWRKGEDGHDEMVAIFAAGSWANAIKAEAEAEAEVDA